MKRVKFFALGFMALLATGAMTSCSQDVTTEQPEASEARQKTTVKELTERLKAYNASVYGVTRATEGPWLDTPVEQTEMKMKVAMADVKGAIRGFFRGGWKGALIGAAVNSLIQAAKEKLFPSMIESTQYPNIIVTNPRFPYADSLGYYHNSVETELYNKNTNCQYRSTAQLVGKADSIMRRKSRGYLKDYNSMNTSAIIRDTEKLRQINLKAFSFDEYCDILKRRDSVDCDYIDFVAEYLYAVNYANVNIDDYTEEVMFMITNANAGVGNVNALNGCLQVAYASTVLSESK